MKACPSLLHFNLQFYGERRPRRYNKRSNMGLWKPAFFLHYHLKDVKITGFSGKRIDKEIVIFLIKMAVALEDITIDPVQTHDVGMPWESDETPEKINARMRAHEIRPHLKTGTKLEIL